MAKITETQKCVYLLSFDLSQKFLFIVHTYILIDCELYSTRVVDVTINPLRASAIIVFADMANIFCGDLSGRRDGCRV